MKEAALASEKLIRKADRMTRRTGVRHDVVHVSGRGGRQYTTVAPAGQNGRHGSHDEYGIVTVLYRPTA